ncbi:MAG: hypothetical protein JJ863_01205 [Deltaproteobacteria bacterium]|nr:hypothetical protein [Deltaproteobacteria bacterium]
MSGSSRTACLLALSLPVVASAQATHEPAPEDAAMIASLLEGRVDVTPERVVHVAPLPGEDGDGSAANPRRDLIRVVANAEPGTAIHLAPGVYEMSAIRDAFGHESSRLKTENAGEAGRPIVVRTEPEAYAAGMTAVLDFAYQNRGDWSSSAFVVAHRHWVFERFEMRRVYRRGFSVNGYSTTLRELHLHHADTDGRDNDALIVMQASGGMTRNVVVQNHLHHVGNIDRETDELIDRGFVNGGCYYSVTRLSYDSEAPAAGHDASRAEWEESLLRPDGHAYVIGNHVHDCHYGLGLKNNSRGPYWFLSNVVHDVDYGVFSPFRETIVRNNIIYDAASAGVELGRAQTNGPLQTYLKMTGNGAHSEVAHNTIVGARLGMNFRAGWGSRVHDNLVVSSGQPVAVSRNSFAWWEDGSWPGIRGEYLLGDLSPDHPFWEHVPGYVREAPEEYERMRLERNCYESEPVIAAADFVQPVADITGMKFDEDEIMVSEAERAALFVDEEAGDHRLADPERACGSRIGTSPVAPMTDAGVPVVDGGVGVDAEVMTADAGTSPSSATGGCGCRVSSGRDRDRAPAFLAIVALVCVSRRLRRRR